VGETGFTLLEVLIAVAILAVSLSSLMASQMNSMAATRYARDITAVALLAEQQLIELEFRHRLEGWVNSDVELEGDFSEQGYDDINWTCTIHFIELPEYNQLVESKEGADDVSGASDDNSIDAGDQAFGALGMVWPMVKAAIENSIRKVDCTLTWNQGKIEQEFAIQTFWTDPNALQAIADAGGGEFSEEDDDSGNDPGGSSTGGAAGGSSGGGGGGGGTRPPSMGGGASGNMGSK
jgi:general secretion pathway protein I